MALAENCGTPSGFLEFATALGATAPFGGATYNERREALQEGVLADLLNKPRSTLFDRVTERVGRLLIPNSTIFVVKEDPQFPAFDADTLRRSVVTIRKEDTRAFGEPGTYDPHFAQR